MQVSLRILGEVEVDDNVDSLDVDTSGEEICFEKQCVFHLQRLFKEYEEEKVLMETHLCRPGFCRDRF